jgi:hypothetical protein
MIDYSALLYDPVYASLGVPAMLTTTSGIVDITIIDETRASNSNFSGFLETRSVRAAACARIYELTQKGVDRSEYDGSPISFNDAFWIIHSHEMLGSPNGEALGQVRFFLKRST